jgi:hypothetical protein
MSKLYTIKFYSQKNGSTKLVEHDLIEKYEYDKKQAFKTGRAELVRIATIDLNNCDDSGDEIKEIINDIIVNKNNNYHYDATNYLFKVFSKKVKK